MIGAELSREPPRAPLTSPKRDGPMIPGCWVTGGLTHSLPEEPDYSSEGSIKPLECGKVQLRLAVPDHCAGPLSQRARTPWEHASS